ncbi:Protein C28H8.5 b [Aphelenchoides avenae]|nr:Protein C28H8.5 b [Aphelenchus avenae]
MTILAILLTLWALGNGVIQKDCVDRDMNCYGWVADDPMKCDFDETVSKECRKACQLCPNYTVPERYDLKKVPSNLQRVAFLIGQWRSEFGGKADFPTIPRFTYGERLDISMATNMRVPVLNYTAFAWDNSDLKELHSENGFITGQSNTSHVALHTVMSNG